MFELEIEAVRTRGSKTEWSPENISAAEGSEDHLSLYKTVQLSIVLFLKCKYNVSCILCHLFRTV